MASTFMIVKNLLVIAIDAIPFVFPHFAIAWSLGFCYCLSSGILFHFYATCIMFALGSMVCFASLCSLCL